MCCTLRQQRTSLSMSLWVNYLSFIQFKENPTTITHWKVREFKNRTEVSNLEYSNLLPRSCSLSLSCPSYFSCKPILWVAVWIGQHVNHSLSLLLFVFNILLHGPCMKKGPASEKNHSVLISQIHLILFLSAHHFYLPPLFLSPSSVEKALFLYFKHTYIASSLVHIYPPLRFILPNTHLTLILFMPLLLIFIWISVTQLAFPSHVLFSITIIQERKKKLPSFLVTIFLECSLSNN